MAKPKKITVETAARLMGKSTLFVREAMRRGVLPIGIAEQMPGSQKWSFYISPKLLADYIGVSVDAVLDAA